MAPDPVGFFSRLTRQYGDVVPLRMGVAKALFVNRPELILQLVRDRHCHRSDESRAGIRSFLGNGLLALEGPTHLRHRRLMSPAFHRDRFAEYGALMCALAYEEAATWQPEQVRDVREDMFRLTFSIVSKTLFNEDTSEEAEQVGAALKEVLPWMLMGAVVAGVVPSMPVLYPPTARAALDRLKRVVHGIVTRRRREGGDRGDLLSMLLAARDDDGAALSDDDICDESLTLLMAGHDTTAMTMTWALYLLAQNHAIQNAAAAEVRAVAGGAHVTTEMLSELPLVRQIIDETLRLYPVVWIGDRTPQRDLMLGPYAIAAGTRVMFSMYVTQRDGRFFPDPDRFDPGRFSQARVGSIPEGAYLPFGAGTHMCIGNNFGLMEARIILASLLQRFAFRLVPGHRVRLDPQVVLSPIGALPLRVTERHWQ